MFGKSQWIIPRAHERAENEEWNSAGFLHYEACGGSDFCPDYTSSPAYREPRRFVLAVKLSRIINVLYDHLCRRALVSHGGMEYQIL